jgi:hypothetical protein
MFGNSWSPVLKHSQSACRSLITTTTSTVIMQIPITDGMRHQCYVNLSSPWNTPGQAGFVVILAEDLRSQPAKSPASLNTKLILVDHLK